MKYTKIAVACSLALVAMSAQAAGPSIPQGTKVIFLSGATAPDNFLADIASSMMTGVTAIRSNDSSILHRAYLGKAAAGITGVTEGTDILFVKRSEGGSVFGVDPVARASRLKSIDFDNCVVGTSPWAWSCGTKGIDPGIANHATSSNTGLVPDFGISDVEPAMFQEPYNTEPGTSQLSSTERARLTNKPLNQIMMGIVATNAVSASTHLSRANYGAMLAGRLATWNEVDGSYDPVVVCRRVNGSGTQVSYNWYFTGFPCNSSTGGFAGTPPATVDDSLGLSLEDDNGVARAGTTADPFIIDPTAGRTIIENSGSSGVVGCLNAAQAGTDFVATGPSGLKYKVLFSSVGGPSKAIGVLSLDSYKAPNLSGAGFTFRHLDGAGTYNGETKTSSANATGIAPSKVNLLNGKYDFVVELSMQKRNTSVTNVNGDQVPVMDSVKTAFYDEFVKRAGSPKYTGNEGGGTLMSVPEAYASLPQTNSNGTKASFVSKFSRDGNTCSPLVSKPAI